MINLDQLEQLVAFAEEGTITKAAEKLLLSQPALTRSLQRLEEDLQVTLFHRQKNKTTFTETGLYTVEQAKILLAQSQDFLDKVRHEDLKNSQLFIGVSAPGPIFELQDLAKEAQLEMTLDFDTQSEPDLLAGLLDGRYQVICTTAPISQDGVHSQPFLMEQLQLSVPTKHILSEREELTLDDLQGLSMLLFTGLGVWDELIASLSGTNFIPQTDMDTFTSLAQASDLPYFTTNVTELYTEENPERISIPITDDIATKTFYISVLDDNTAILKTLGI